MIFSFSGQYTYKVCDLYDRYAAALYGDILRAVYDQDVASLILRKSFTRISNELGNYNSDKGRLYSWMWRLVQIEIVQHKVNSDSRVKNSGNVVLV